MAIEYRRVGSRITIGLDAHGNTVARAPFSADTWLSATALAAAMAGDFTPLRATVQPVLGTPQTTPSSREAVIAHLEIEVADARTAAIDWEAVLAPLRPKAAIVRVTDAEPRMHQIPFTFPMRIATIDAGPAVELLIGQTFAVGDARPAVIASGTTLGALRMFLEANAWPTADVLHFGQLGAITRETLLRTSTPEVAGSLGWMLRIVDEWQTRLIVIEAPPDASALREYAQRIVMRGGPAVWIVPPGVVGTLYEYLVHDRPLDWIQQRFGTRVHPPHPALFAGAGREEALRFSHIGRALTGVDPARIQPHAPRDIVGEVEIFHDDRSSLSGPGLKKPIRAGEETYEIVGRRYRSTLTPQPRTRMRGAPAGAINALRGVGALMPTIQFEQHESEGVVPLAHAVNVVRTNLPKPKWPLRTGKKPKRRNVNAGFFTLAEDRKPLLIAQKNARLITEKLVYLGVQISATNQFTTVGPSALIEEYFRWQGSDDVRYLEIGVTPLDFDLIGEPVQELRLPAVGETDIVLFAVRPKQVTAVHGVARIRFSLYANGNLVQSFLVAALLDMPIVTARQRLAAALSIRESDLGDIGDAGYVSRLEYSASKSIDAAPKLPPRALSIVANESAGEKVVTLKGAELFTFSSDQNMVPKLDALRGALRNAARNAADEYLYDDENRGDEVALKTRLYDLAEKGWDVFQFLVRGEDDRAKVREALKSGGTIHAAHIQLGDVIPWSLLYDREIDRGHVDDVDPQGNTLPVPQLLCTAAMPQADGGLPAADCAEVATCELHPSRVAERKANGELVSEDAVVCPRRFWGYRHPIEVPAQQAKNGLPPDPVTTIATSKRPALFAGFNPNLSLSGPHEKTLRQVTSKAKRPATVLPDPVAAKRSLIKKLLSGPDEPDVIYFYCHANPSLQLVDGSQVGPNLDFGEGKTAAEVFIPAQLTGRKWKHHPLVFLNACASVGFNPSAPAEFVTLFVQEREASAVIGTEVQIWEVLANEVALHFFTRFLDYDAKGDAITAGDALLYARRMLLAKHNPLGLVYTLYGSADLRMG
jgi:hypothetical protein